MHPHSVVQLDDDRHQPTKRNKTNLGIDIIALTYKTHIGILQILFRGGKLSCEP
eukprot:SAG31_NODE_36297_length_314_cov_1.297674_1_plen_53_part_10